MRRAHPREGFLSVDGAAVRIAYRNLVGHFDSARRWIVDGEIDARFVEGDVPARSIRRGTSDLMELHDIVDDLFGVGCFDRPRPDHRAVEGVVTGQLTMWRPADVMPFVETIRPQLERRGPAFWTWKTARESIAARLQTLEHLTVEAVFAT